MELRQRDERKGALSFKSGGAVQMDQYLARAEIAAAQAAAEAAQTAAETAVSRYPKIVSNYWYVWDTTVGDFVNTGVSAEGYIGEDGISPTITIDDITGGHRLTITDAAHPQGVSIDVLNGTQGQTGPAGPGVPAGGAAGQVLKKKSSADYDAEWTNTPPQMGSLATIEASPATQAHAVGDYIVYNGQLYKVTAAISPGETLTPGTNTAATNASESFLPKGRMIDITNQCQIGTGTIGYVRYYQTDNIIVLAIQVFNINFTGVNVWLRLPDSFPGNANVFTALATGFDGMVCVFRTQSGNGKYLLIQSTQQGSYNLTGTGICFA